MTPPEALALLELSRPFTEAELRKAWHQALLTWHPDRFPDATLHPQASATTQDINQAYELLLRTTADHPAGVSGLHALLARFWTDRGYTVGDPSQPLPPAPPPPFAAEAEGLLAHAHLAAFHAGPTVQIRVLIHGDALSDYAIADRFPRIHEAAMRLRQHAAPRSQSPSLLSGVVPDRWIPFRTHDTIALIHVVFTSAKRARLFRKNFSDEARFTSRLYHVHARLSVIDLESGTLTQDIARPRSIEREEFASLSRVLFGNTPPAD